MEKYTTRNLPVLTYELCVALLAEKKNIQLCNNTILASWPSEPNAYIVYLHGHPIIKITKEATYISTAGWDTNTTKQRLNTLTHANVWQEKYAWHVASTRADGVPLRVTNWDGSWLRVF